MSGTQLFLEALSKGWLLDKTYVDARLPLIANAIKGKPVDFGVKNLNPGQVSAITMISAGVTLAQPSWYDGFDRAPEGSFAVITIRGPIMHYGWCNDGSAEIADLVRQAQASSKIKGIFFDVDTPGGQVDGTADLASVIKACTKPTLAFIRGMAASAGLWIISAADESYCANDLVMVGSCGVYTTIYDYREYFATLGIKVLEIYAPQSGEKNKHHIDAINGNEKALKEILRTIAGKFISTVEINLADQLTSDDWKTGKIYFAPEAETIGLITGIKSYEQSLARLEELSNGDSSSKSKNTNKNKAMNPFENIQSLSEVETPTAEQVELANGDLKNNKINSVILVESSFLDEAANVTTERNSLADEKVKLTADLADANSKLEAANKSKDDTAAENVILKEKISKKSGGDLSSKTEETETSQVTEGAELDKQLAELPHNSSILNNPLFG